MTTNLYAIAGPSKPASVATTSSVSPRSEAPSPLKAISSLPEDSSANGGSGGGVNKNGLSLDENGEVLKVPAFLNKLFTMVSDSTVDELIYWGESGDSFFVPNAEHFGRELLPRWFKHSNFSSFVRQLNMYGFHKVPHLQSGALKNETPVELWEFANPFFKRGQPKLLAKVTRKNNRPGAPPPPAAVSSGAVNTRAASQAAAVTSAPSSGKYLITDGTVEGEAGPLIGPAGQVADLNAIHSGIAAIRQTQANIGAELRKLQSSNEALWRQAYETQEKQRKHEDTINLIVSFLERLFGTEGEGLKGLKEAMRRGGVGGRPREDSAAEETGSAKKRRRVGLDRMIGDGKAGVDPDMSDDDRLVEIGSSSQYSMPPFSRSGSGSKRSGSATPTDPWSSSAPRFTTLPTEDESTPSTRGASKPPITPGQDQTLGTNHLSPLSDTENLLPSDNNALAPYNLTNGNFGNNTSGGPSQPLFSPSSAEAAASAFNLDPSLLQTTIGSLLQSPAAAQMFLNSLNNSSQGQALTTPNAKYPPPNQTSFPFNNTSTIPQNSNGVDPNMDPTLALLTPLPNQDALMNHSGDLLKSYQDAASIDGGLDQLQESIDSMVRSMGLDLPSNGGDVKPPGGFDNNAAMGMGTTMGGGGEQLVDSDFNVDEFLEHLAKSEEAGGGDGTSLAGLQGNNGLGGGGNA
ncbi:hypothetical protein CI109_100079 [Kwoniella shandongensis]|uniref:Uncharacterized protein n=1 Tax=Kwoniella shandongensis TaxID=1734106 RepID=A0A5M6BU88_9TREE|nr:uncharacterized protein CI109_005948 [Kwoniella shandongensis]KAA5525640.1 hypothetical protein CI109_005948 [Kwoniella shandongensis]